MTISGDQNGILFSYKQNSSFMLKSDLILVFNFHVFLSFININKNEKKIFQLLRKKSPVLNQMTGCPTKNVKSLI